MQEFYSMALEFAKNHTIMVITWLVVFIFVIVTFFKSATSGSKVVEHNEATMLINREDAVVVDLRSLEEFNRGHIINSLSILPTEIKNKNLGQLEHHKDKPIILVCATGMTAKASAEQLVKQGFARVYTLKEGIAGWRGANLPLVK